MYVDLYTCATCIQTNISFFLHSVLAVFVCLVCTCVSEFPKGYCSVRNSKPLHFNLSQLNSVHILTSYFININCKDIIPSRICLWNILFPSSMTLKFYNKEFFQTTNWYCCAPCHPTVFGTCGTWEICGALYPFSKPSTVKHKCSLSHSIY
jgi:hypothetical protein